MPSLRSTATAAAVVDLALPERRPSFAAQLSGGERKILIALVDLLIAGSCLVSAAYIGSTLFSVEYPAIHWFGVLSLIATWLLIATALEIYSASVVATSLPSAAMVVKAIAVGCALYLLIPIPQKYLVPRSIILIGGALSIAALPVWRIVAARAIVAGLFRRRILLLGGDADQRVVEQLQQVDPSYDFIGRASLTSITDEVGADEKSLLQYAQDRRVTHIILADDYRITAPGSSQLVACLGHGIRIKSLAEFEEEVTGRIPLGHSHEAHTLHMLLHRRVATHYAIIKRCIDILLAVVGIVILLPFVPLIALAIKLDSPGPVLYRPRRLGLGGRPFRPIKFRSMVSDADLVGDPTFTSTNDARVTRLGRLLRITHIDELPQLFNVLKGEMSIVGPRPERHVPEFEHTIPFYRARYVVKPGAAGWALVRQGYAEGADDTFRKLEYDLFYIKHQSLALDLRILAKTVATMISLRGR